MNGLVWSGLVWFGLVWFGLVVAVQCRVEHVVCASVWFNLT